MEEWKWKGRFSEVNKTSKFYQLTAHAQLRLVNLETRLKDDGFELIWAMVYGDPEWLFEDKDGNVFEITVANGEEFSTRLNGESNDSYAT